MDGVLRSDLINFLSIECSTAQDIDLASLGDHWSYDKEMAQCYNNGNHKLPRFLLKLTISKSQIDWPQTLARQVGEVNGWEEGLEKEVNPKKGSYPFEVYLDDKLVAKLKGSI